MKLIVDYLKKLQDILKSNLNKLSKRRLKSEEQKSALENIKLHYKSRQAVIKLFNDYFSIASEAKHKVIHGERLKTLTAKQMLQRLLIALALVKTGNASENLLNEIRQIIFFLFIKKKKLLNKYKTV